MNSRRRISIPAVIPGGPIAGWAVRELARRARLRVAGAAADQAHPCPWWPVSVPKRATVSMASRWAWRSHVISKAAHCQSGRVVKRSHKAKCPHELGRTGLVRWPLLRSHTTPRHHRSGQSFADIQQAMIMLFARKLPAVRLVDHSEPSASSRANSRDAPCTAAVEIVPSECYPEARCRPHGLHTLCSMAAGNSAFVCAPSRSKLDQSERPWTL